MTSENTQFISMGERLALLLGLGGAFIAAYIYLNFHPFFAPRALPMTAIDSATPFLVWTVWPYAFMNISNAIMPFFIKRRDEFRRMAKTLAIVMAVHVLFWALWPTTFPRPPVPMGDTLSDQLYRFLIVIDAPNNCFPSAHVAAPSVQLYFLGRAWPKLAPWLWAGFALISLSILTTKQHYAWDLAGAATIVFFALTLTGWVTTARKVKA